MVMPKDAFCSFVNAAKSLRDRGFKSPTFHESRDSCLENNGVVPAVLGHIAESIEKRMPTEEESRKSYEESFAVTYTRAITADFFEKRFVGLRLAKDYPSRCVFERLRQRIWSDVAVKLLIGWDAEGVARCGIGPFDRDAGQRLLKLSRQLRCPTVDELFPKRYTRRRAIYEKWLSLEAA